MKTGRLSAKIISETYSRKGCNITATCLALGISRVSFYKWKSKYPKLKIALEAADDAILDAAESKLLEHINGGDTTCLIFLLKTKGKNRGYVERVDQNVTVNPFMELMQAATSQDGK